MTIRSEIQTKNIRSLGFRNIREWVTFWRLILHSLECIPKILIYSTLGIHNNSFFFLETTYKNLQLTYNLHIPTVGENCNTSDMHDQKNSKTWVPQDLSIPPTLFWTQSHILCGAHFYFETTSKKNSYHYQKKRPYFWPHVVSNF